MTSTGMVLLPLDEIGGVEVISHLVAHEPQTGESALYRRPLRRGVHDAFVCLVVIPDQGGIDHGYPPHRLPITVNACT